MKAKSLFRPLTLGIVLRCVLQSYPGLAQVTPDTSLGTEPSLVRSQTLPTLATHELIEGGAVRGPNLFHSFEAFSIPEGGQTYFANPIGIEQIFSRVTGDSVSHIDGTLGVLGSADLFVLNPNGIVFGPGARLDLAGSFTASTATSFDFSTGDSFTTSSTAAAPSLLNVNVPFGLQFNRPLQGELRNGASLAVGPGQSLNLLGNTVLSEGSLVASGGTVRLLGERVGLRDRASIDVSSATQAGRIFIGGDIQGQGSLPRARRTFVGPEVQLTADALARGNGGQVVVWSDEVTAFYGSISARGGQALGQGGFAEVSSAQDLTFEGEVDLSAARGRAGLFLLDPANIVITNGAGGASDDEVIADRQILFGDGPVDGTFEISEQTLEGLSGDANLVLQATNDITVEDLTDNSLTFSPGGGFIQFVADADLDGAGDFVMRDVADTIFTDGRNLSISGVNLTLGSIDTTVLPITAFNIINVDAGGPIPPSGTAGTSTFTFTVPTTIGDSITDLDVRFSAEHTFNSDLSATLTSPRGSSIELFNAVGGSQDNFQDTLFDDAAVQPITAGQAPFTGRFQTSGLDGGLERFNGRLRAGTWTLTVTDMAGGDSGRLLQAGDTAFGEIVQGTQLLVSSMFDPTVEAGSVTLQASGNIAINDVVTVTQALERDGGSISIASAFGDITANELRSSSSPHDEDTGRGGPSGNSGNGGDISISSTSGSIATNLISSSSFAYDDSGNGGNISISSTSGDIVVGGVSSSAGGYGFLGNGGNISISSVSGTITADSIASGASAVTGDAGNGGDISISSASGDIKADVISSESRAGYGHSSGNGGSISISSSSGNISAARLSSDSSTFESSTGDGGNISISSNSGNIFTEQITATAFAAPYADLYSGTSGNGGNISLSSLSGDIVIQPILETDIRFADIRLDATSFSARGESQNGGKISLTSPSGNILGQEGALIATLSLSLAGASTGEGGNVSLEGREVSGVEVLTISGTRRSGNVILQNPENDLIAKNLRLTTTGQIEIPNRLTPGQPIILDISQIGQSGDTSITSLGNITLENVIIQSDANGNQAAGNIRFQTPRQLRLINSQINSNTNQRGRAGSILSEAAQVILDSSELSTSTISEGQGGELTINATDSIALLNGSQLLAQSAETASGRAGDIELRADNISFDDGSIVATSTLGLGDAGDITLQPSDGRGQLAIALQNSEITAATSGSGNGGDINLSAADAITISGIGILNAQTSATGSAGNITVTTDRFTLDQGTQLTTTATETARPPANTTFPSANINLNANEMNLFGTVQILSETQGSAQAGSLTLNPNRSDNLTINLREQSRISASTSGSGRGGNLLLSAPNQLTISGQGTLSAETSGSGSAGQVEVQAQQFTLADQARLSTSTSGLGQGGTLNLNVADSITLRNQASLVAQSTETASGRAGDINLATGQLALDNSSITVRSAGMGDGGNINVELDRVLLLRDRSLIETDAGGSGNGGNIGISAPFLFGFGNSDIIANALSGNGGRINIVANNLFNFNIQDGLNRDQLRANTTNNISASSETGTSGTIVLDTLNVDPAESLSELPSDFVDGSRLIAQDICRDGDGSEFIVTGRGGLPPAPNDVFQPDSEWEDWRISSEQLALEASQHQALSHETFEQRSLSENGGQVALSNSLALPRLSQTPSHTSSLTPSPQLQEAQGWAQSPSGEIQLTPHRRHAKASLYATHSSLSDNALNCRQHHASAHLR